MRIVRIVLNARPQDRKTARPQDLLFATSIVAYLLYSGCSQNNFDPNLQGSVLEASPGVQNVDLGNVRGGIATHVFQVRNSGVEPIVVSSVVKNCACTTTSVRVGDCIEAYGELPVSVTLNGRPAGGVEAGVLFLETVSKSMMNRKVQLRLEASFPKMFWTEFAPADRPERGRGASTIKLHSIEPGILSKFDSVTVKPEVASLILIEKSSSDFLEFRFEVNAEMKEEYASVFAVFRFNDLRFPIHTELVLVPHSAIKK